MNERGARTKWGRAKFAGGRLSAMTIAIPSGLILGAASGLIAVWAGVVESNPVIGGAVFAIFLTMPAIALVYVLVVDRGTMEGAAERPEDSIESRWYDRAAAGAHADVILLAGVVAAVLAFIPGDPALDPSMLLAGVIGVSFASFAIRYLLLRRTS